MGKGKKIGHKINNKEKIMHMRKNQNIKILKSNKNYYIKKSKSYLDLNKFIDEESEGLTKKQINVIKKIGFKTIRISQTIPFAPFIFLGVLITIIVKGNILILVKNII